jgi:hypothetical protein
LCLPKIQRFFHFLRTKPRKTARFGGLSRGLCQRSGSVSASQTFKNIKLNPQNHIRAHAKKRRQFDNRFTVRECPPALPLADGRLVHMQLLRQLRLRKPALAAQLFQYYCHGIIPFHQAALTRYYNYEPTYYLVSSDNWSHFRYFPQKKNNSGK